MREWSEERTAELLESPAAAEQLAACDVAAIVFDSSDLHSFRTAHRLLLRIAQAAGDSLPCVLIAAKDDLGMDQVSAPPSAPCLPAFRSALLTVLPIAWPALSITLCWLAEHWARSSLPGVAIAAECPLAV